MVMMSVRQAARRWRGWQSSPCCEKTSRSLYCESTLVRHLLTVSTFFLSPRAHVSAFDATRKAPYLAPSAPVQPGGKQIQYSLHGTRRIFVWCIPRAACCTRYVVDLLCPVPGSHFLLNRQIYSSQMFGTTSPSLPIPMTKWEGAAPYFPSVSGLRTTWRI
jgi:hypothetical protein